MINNMIPHNYDGKMITQLSEDAIIGGRTIGGRTIPKGYCNATLMLGAASAETGKRKQWSNYIKSQSTQEYLQELSQQENRPIVNNPETSFEASAQPRALQPLVIVIKGGEPLEQGTWVQEPMDATEQAIAFYLN